MLSDDLRGWVREALVKHSRLRLETIRGDHYLSRDLGFDSFALLQVVLDLEDRLEIEIDPDKLAGLRDMTFQELVDLVEAQLERARIASGGPAR